MILKKKDRKDITRMIGKLTPKKKSLDPAILKESVNGIVFGIVPEGNQFTIKRKSGDGYEHIGGEQNRPKFSFPDPKKAHRMLNIMLSENNSLLFEDKYVLKTDEPEATEEEPMEAEGEFEGTEEEGMEGDSQEEEEDLRGNDEFMKKYGDAIEAFGNANEDNKKWMLNTMISKLDIEEDSEVITSAAEKLEEKTVKGETYIPEGFEVKEKIDKKKFFETYKKEKKEEGEDLEEDYDVPASDDGMTPKNPSEFGSKEVERYVGKEKVMMSPSMNTFLVREGIDLEKLLS